MQTRQLIAIICHNDELSLSLTWLDCLPTDSEIFFILFAENFIPILLTIMYLVALYQETEL